MPGAASSPDSAPNPIGGLPAGSRNAPLSFALHAADAAGRLRLHVRIDERTAGFLALGLALASGRPVPVCTTSGTDVAKLVTTPSFK